MSPALNAPREKLVQIVNLSVDGVCTPRYGMNGSGQCLHCLPRLRLFIVSAISAISAINVSVPHYSSGFNCRHHRSVFFGVDWNAFIAHDLSVISGSPTCEQCKLGHSRRRLLRMIHGPRKAIGTAIMHHTRPGRVAVIGLGQ